MKKTFFAILLVVILCLSFSVPVFAVPNGEYVYDHNGKLSEYEASELSAMAAQLYDTYGFDVLLDMDNSVTESAISYAERRYDETGAAADGIILAITAEKWYIHAAGDAQDVFSESSIDDLWSAYNVETTYYGGVLAYIKTAGQLLDDYYGLGNPFAEENPFALDEPMIPETRQKPRLVDDADLLTTSEETSLLSKLDEISERQQCDVAVVTVDSLDGKTSEAYADDYYDYNGYGMGVGDDGILLLISMADRDWAITTYGFAIPAFTDAGQAYMVDKFKPDLSAGNYYSAFNRFANLCDDFLTKAKTGDPYDSGNLPDSNKNVGFLRSFVNLLILTVPIGIILSFVITAIMKRSLKTVRSEVAASSYVRTGSISITDSRDVFLYSTVSKTARSSDSSSGGGSSTHSSSSGRSHGGSSGKF